MNEFNVILAKLHKLLLKASKLKTSSFKDILNFFKG